MQPVAPVGPRGPVGPVIPVGPVGITVVREAMLSFTSATGELPA